MIRNLPCATGLLAVLVLGIATAGTASAEENDCHRLAMEVVCNVTPAKVILVGDPFDVRATVTNTGDLALANVTFALAGTPGVTYVGGDELKQKIEKLPPGESRTITCKFVCDAVGSRRVNASAREERGWAASGCICQVLVKGLPALQMEMIDLDLSRQAEGIFKKGDEFIYILKVENDVGTALTEDLKIMWQLPPELEFVSGTADGGSTVTGTAQTAESSVFALDVNKAQNFELVVRVIGVPPDNLVQTRAAVVSSNSGKELATETESTTLQEAN